MHGVTGTSEFERTSLNLNSHHQGSTFNMHGKSIFKPLYKIQSINDFEGLVAYDDDSQSDSENKSTSGSSHQNPNVRSFVAMSCCARFPFAGFRFRFG